MWDTAGDAIDAETFYIAISTPVLTGVDQFAGKRLQDQKSKIANDNTQ